MGKNHQKNVAGITDAQAKKASEDDANRIVPLKDAARINTALSVTLSNAEISAYINKTHQASIKNYLQMLKQRLKKY